MKRKLADVNILVVEDDAAMRDTLRDVLQRTGATVFEAVNGQEAWLLLERERTDLVISDVQMPVMDGIELLKRIRSKSPGIPIVLLATGQSKLTEESALAAGAAGLILKPFRLKHLIEKITHLLTVSKIVPN